jgi:hypothetical protein
MDISNFQLDSAIDHRTENPCVGGSIPSLAIFFFNHLQTAYLSLTPNVPDIAPLTSQKQNGHDCSVAILRHRVFCLPQASLALARSSTRT